jgi:hypothetical protein
MGENMRHWIVDAPPTSSDVGGVPRLQVVVAVGVCQFNLRRLDGYRRPAQ